MLLGHQPVGCCGRGALARPGREALRACATREAGACADGGLLCARADGVLLRHLLARLPGPAARERGRLPRLLLLPQGGARENLSQAGSRACVLVPGLCFATLCAGASPGSRTLLGRPCRAQLVKSLGPGQGAAAWALLCGSLLASPAAAAGPACSRGSSVSRARRPAAPVLCRPRDGQVLSPLAAPRAARDRPRLRLLRLPVHLLPGAAASALRPARRSALRPRALCSALHSRLPLRAALSPAAPRCTLACRSALHSRLPLCAPALWPRLRPPCEARPWGQDTCAPWNRCFVMRGYQRPGGAGSGTAWCPPYDTMRGRYLTQIPSSAEGPHAHWLGRWLKVGEQLVWPWAAGAAGVHHMRHALRDCQGGQAASGREPGWR